MIEEHTADIIVERVNGAHIRLYIRDDGIRKDIHEHFTYPEPGFKKNKWTKWDGTVRLFKLRGNLLPYGCLKMLVDLAKDRGWSLELDDAFRHDVSKVTIEELKEWVKTLNLRTSGFPIEPYDYQIESLYLSIRYNRLVILAATSAGKSLIIYLLTRYYEMLCNDDGRRILVLVPSQMLVDQLYDDFKDYSSANGWDVNGNVHTIMEGRPKTSKKMVYISTWQSIYEESPEYFETFGRLVVDEVHLSSGESISGIANKCVNAYQRVGLTGTLKADKVHPILVMSLFGTVKRVVTSKQLIDAGRATETDIKILQLIYDQEECKYVSTECNYQKEIDFLIAHSHRNKVIAMLAATAKGNTLVMFDRLEHIESVRKQLESISHSKNVFCITGEVDRDERAAIKAIAEKDEGVIVLGTAGCVSTGLSIRRLKNLIFAHPYKSIIRILQSVGRLLRKHEDKECAHVYDLLDVLSYGDKPNYALKHGVERVGIYKNDEFPTSFRKINMVKHTESNK